MTFTRTTISTIVLMAIAGFTAAADKPLTPGEARKKVGESIEVEVTVKTAKDRLEKSGEDYLDCEDHFSGDRSPPSKEQPKVRTYRRLAFTFRRSCVAPFSWQVNRIAPSPA